MQHHIKDTWYVDMGIEDTLNEGEYFYIDEFCTLCKSNEYDEKADGVSRRIGVRAFYAIDPDAEVFVFVEKRC